MTFCYAGGGADDDVVTLLHIFISLMRGHVLR